MVGSRKRSSRLTKQRPEGSKGIPAKGKSDARVLRPEQAQHILETANSWLLLGH